MPGIVSGLNRIAAAAALASVVLPSSAAQALDCAKASSAVDKAICGSPAARKADAAMAKAYFAVMAPTQDRIERDALIASQKAWLKAWAGQGEQDYAEADGDFAGLLRRQSLARTTDLERHVGGIPAFVANMRRQRALLQAHPGRLAGFSAECFIEPPRFGSGSYACMPVLALQKGGRLCRTETSWASGHMTDVWTVARVEADCVKLLATCKEGYASGPECPNSRAADAGGWTHTPGIGTPDAADLAKALKLLDPEVNAKLDRKMKACLSEAEYPPRGAFIADAPDEPKAAR